MLIEANVLTTILDRHLGWVESKILKYRMSWVVSKKIIHNIVGHTVTDIRSDHV